MPHRPRYFHLLDDMAMGGVTRALANFQHPRLTALGEHLVTDINQKVPKTRRSGDIAIIHFTANWKKLTRLMDLRYRRGFDQIILIEHTYTAGFERHCVPHPKRFHQMLRFAYSLVDTVVAVSEAQRQWMIESELAAPQKILTITQARDCSELESVPAVVRDQRPVRIGAFGRFHEQKGFDLLVRAASRIPSHLFTLKLAGAGDEAGLLKVLSHNSPNIKIVPAFSSPTEFLNSVDWVAIPSRWEAFGLVGLEARSAGRPIIAAQVDGLIDQIGESGIGHDPCNVDALETALWQAIRSQDISHRSARAREEAQDAFDSMLAGWENLLSAPELAIAA